MWDRMVAGHVLGMSGRLFHLDVGGWTWGTGGVCVFIITKPCARLGWERAQVTGRLLWLKRVCWVNLSDFFPATVQAQFRGMRKCSHCTAGVSQRCALCRSNMGSVFSPSCTCLVENSNSPPSLSPSPHAGGLQALFMSQPFLFLTLCCIAQWRRKHRPSIDCLMYQVETCWIGEEAKLLNLFSTREGRGYACIWVSSALVRTAS